MELLLVKEMSVEQINNLYWAMWVMMLWNVGVSVSLQMAWEEIKELKKGKHD